MKKRLIAFLLMLAMMMSSFGDIFQSRIYYAVAEGETDPVPDVSLSDDGTATDTDLLPKEYTVTYMIDGVQYGEAEAYVPGEALTPRDAPEAQNGYTFSGWSELPETMPGENVIVTGSWIQDDVNPPMNLLGAAPASAPALLGAGSGASGNDSGPTMTALEQLIENKFNDIGSTLSGRVRIILNNNTTYKGESTISAKKRTVADDFVLELVASDAGENGMKGNGQTVIDDNLVINGIKVIMQSIIISAGKTVTVRNAVDADSDHQSRGGSLEYVGAEALPTELDVTVGQNSSLDVITADKGDTITVTSAAGARSVNIDAGDGTNTILATVSGGDLNIRTGADPDNVEVRIIGSGTESQIGDVIVDTGAGNDALYVLNNGKSKNQTSQVHNGIERTETVMAEDGQPARDEAGNNITLTYHEDALSGIVISAGSGDDTITLDVRSNAGDMILNTGAGGDVVLFRKGDLNTEEDLDYNHVFTPYETVRGDGAGARVILNNGAADPDVGGDAVDFVTIDVSVARAIREVQLTGGKGASVHLKGILAPNVSADDRIKWKQGDPTTLQVQAASALDPNTSRMLEISMPIDVTRYNFTDKLTNKREQALYIPEGTTEDYTFELSLADFTDYVIKSPISNVNRISVTARADSSNPTPFLSNLVLDADETHDDDDTLTIHNIYNGSGDSITPIPLNILAKAPTIEFVGTVAAQNVRAESVQGTKAFSYLASLSRSVGDTIDNAINLYDCAEIIVKKGAVIQTAHDTALVARVKHFGGTLTLAMMLQIVNIKVATAAVQVDGTISAGGSVTADAIIETQEGNKIVDIEGEAGNPTGVFVTDGDVVPVGIKVVLNDASVEIGGDAVVTAAENDVLLNAKSNVTIYNYENGTYPFAVAVAFVNADVKTIVEGTIRAGRSVLLNADGRVISDSQAKHRDDTQDASANVYVALSVVDQDVDAVISGGKVEAGRGDVAIYATAIAKVKSIASASAMEKSMAGSLPEVMSPVGLLTTVLKGILTPFKAGYKWVRGKFRDSDYYTKKLEKLVNKISAGDYDVSVASLSPENDEKGTATVKVKVSKFTAGDKTHQEGEVAEGQEGGVDGLFAVVDIKPKSGYAVQKVQYRYLKKEATDFTYVSVLPNDKGEYIFALKHKDTPYEVIVTYMEAGQAANAEGERAQVSLDDLEDGYSINGIMDDADEGIAEDAAQEEENGQKTGKDFVSVGDMSNKTKVNLAITQPRNPDETDTKDIILTWQTQSRGAGLENVTLTEVYAGQEVRFIGNPASSGKELKKLKIKYTIRTESGVEVPMENEVKPDSLGRFIFTVPENIIGGQAHNIQVSGEFGPKDATTGPAHNQLTGTLGFSYVNNQSHALIESRTTREVAESINYGSTTVPVGYKATIHTPEVTAGGTVEMLGIHMTSVETLADGSAVKEKPVMYVSADEAKPQEIQKVKWTVPGTDYAVKVSSNLQGEITTAMTKEQDDENGHATFSHPTFTFTPADSAQGTKAYDHFHVEISYYTKFNNPMAGAGRRVSDVYSFSGATIHPDEERTISFSHNAEGLVITVTKGSTTSSYTVSGDAEYTIESEKITVSADRKSITVGEGSDARTFSTKISEGDITVDDITGRVTFKPSLAKLAVVEGTTMDVNFVFQDAEGNTLYDGNGTEKYAIANPINIQFNGLRKDKTLAATILNDNLIEMGTITYHNTITNADNSLTYQFAVKANPGYKLDSKGSSYATDKKSNTKVLYASWIGPDGLSHKQALVRDESNTFTGAEVWEFKMSSNSAIPEGATVSIIAVFEKDARNVEVKTDHLDQKIRDDLKVTLSKTKAASGDSVTVKVKLEDEALTGRYAASHVTWYVSNHPETSHQADLDKNGQVSITLPDETFDPNYPSATLIIRPQVISRSVTLTPADESVRLSEKEKGYLGETVTVTLSDEELLLGKKISAIKVNGVVQKMTVNGEEKNRTDSFVIPNNAGELGTLTISVETREGEYAIESFTSPDGLGSIEPVCAKADNGETVQLKIKPKDGYRAKYNSVKVTLVTSTRTRKITAAWKADNLYTFDLNLNEGEKLTAPIKIEGKFEAGKDGVALSMGLGAAIGIIIGKNQVEIRDGVITAGESLSMVGVSMGGKASTEARAGYSEGKTGVAGALGVQIASAENDVIIHKDSDSELPAGNAENKRKAQEANAKLLDSSGRPKNPTLFPVQVRTYDEYVKDKHSSITVGKTETVTDPETHTEKEVYVPGSIFIQSTNTEKFQVTGDAANKKETEAKGTGVGAGIALAIDRIRTAAEIEDGVWLVNTGELSSLSVKAKQKVMDKVTARAGAVGGSAFVPVAAVDIYESDTKAIAGKMKLLEINAGGAAALPEQTVLKVNGSVKVSAETAWTKQQYNHEITADASARGGKTTLGGAFIVTWMDTDTRAELNQSVQSNREVSITSYSAESLKAVAVAAVSGGNAGSTDEKGEGSADKQANSILKGGAGMAEKYGGMDGDAIKADGENRQKAETAESSVAGAGSVVVNMMKNKSRAEILDDVDVEAAGKLKVTSTNRTEATIRANASTTNSDTGVGVGVALNIVKMDNIARIGSGKIEAGELELRAEIAEAPSYAVEVFPTENMSPFAEQLRAAAEDGLKKLLGDHAVSNIVGSALSEAAGRVAGKLIDDLNLTPLFSSVGDSALDTLVNAADTLVDRVKELPKALVSPLWLLVEQTIGTVSGWDEERFGNLFEDVWTTATVQLAGNTVGMTRTVLQESLGSLVNSALNMSNRLLMGEGFDVNIVVDKVKSTAVNLFDRVVEKTVQDVVKRMSAEIPLMTESNMQLIREMENTSFQKIKDSVVPYVTKTIRDQVWDYEPVLVKVQEKGFKEFMKSEAKALLKEGTTALTNEMIDGIVGKLDVGLPPEPSADRHVITTQAISGAGARTDSGAGSISIAVVNMETRAEIAAGSNPVTVRGDMIINAEELRRIRTHASAAVDPRSGDPVEAEPDNNEGVGDSDQANTGSSNAACPNVKKSDNGIITVSYSQGGDATTVDDFGFVELEAEAGFKIPKQVVRRWTTKDGKEHADLLAVDTKEKAYYVFKGLKEEDVVSVETDVVFEEVLRVVPKPQFKYTEDVSGLYEYDKTISVHIEGRESEDGKVSARANDLAKIVVPVRRGLVVKTIDVTLEKSGKTLTFGGGDTDEISLVSSNKNEQIYVFKVPDEQIRKITVHFDDEEYDDPEDAPSNSKAKDNDKSVGAGAAFAFTYGNSEVVAQIGARGKDTGGSRGKVEAGTISITARSEHEEENYSTAGTDPIEGTGTDQPDGAGEKKTGADVSLAINILDNDIYAGIAAGTIVKTTAVPGVNDPERTPDNGDGEEEEKDAGEDDPEDIEIRNGALIISATEVSENETKASAFATGSTTAIGASVAVNVSLSEIEATLGSGAEASGKVVVRSHSVSKDNTWSFASAMGADIQRNLNKLANKREKTEKTVNDLTTGKIFDETPQKKGNDTGERIADGMNRSKAEDGQNARGDLPVSMNAARSQNAKADSAKDGKAAADNPDDENNALKAVKEASGVGVTGQNSGNDEPRLQAAATVAVTVTNHKARTNVSGSITAKDGEISLTSFNAGNFRTRSTAAAMSLAEAIGGGKDIAMAIGISVNRNEAIVNVKGNLEAARGDVTVGADLKQNLTDEFRGYLAVQAVSGSFSGKGYDYSIAGALSMVVSHAATRATVENKAGTAEKPAAIKGDAVSITANDKSKLAIRAGGINISKGTNKGVGISVATIWSGNTVEASVGDNTRIETEDLTLSAQKEKVTYDDFEWPVGLSNFITDSSELSDEQRENVYTGIIDVHRKPGEKSYTVDINADSYALMNFVDELNFLSSQNYYVEAIAGSLITGQSDTGTANALNLAGSFSIVRAKNRISAILGKNVTILQKQAVAAENATNEEKAAAEALNKILHENNVHISATGDTTTRLIGGAISAGSAKKAGGITVTFLYNQDAVKADAGDGLSISAGGDVTQQVSADMEVLTINAAAAVSTEIEEKSKAMGGSLDLILLSNKAINSIGDSAKIQGGSVDLTAKANADVIMIILSAMGAAKGTAAGGTVAWTDNQAEARVNVGKDHRIEAGTGDINITAESIDRVVSVAASASVGLDTEDGSGKAYAGTLNIIHSRAQAQVKLETGGSGHGIIASNGNVTVAGETGTRAANATLAAAGGRDTAIGLNLNFNFFTRKSGVNIKGGDSYEITAGKDVKVSADGTDLTVLAALAATASKGKSISGNLPILVSKNEVLNTIGKASITAGGGASFTSGLKDRTVAVAGQVAVSLDLTHPGDEDDVAAGAAAMFAIKTNTVKTTMGTSTVTAKGGDVLVSAKGDDHVYAITAGVAITSGDKGVAANMVISTNRNTIHADAGKAALNAVNTVTAAPKSGGNVTVEATGNSEQWAVTGGLNASYSNSVGAGLIVLTASKDVKATGHDMNAYGNVSVTADNTDKVNELSVNVGGALSDEGSATVDTGISIQVLKNKVNAAAASTVKAHTGEFNLKAGNTSNLDNINIALAASNSKYTATPVFALTYYGGETNALLGSGTVDAAGAVNVIADAHKDIDQYTIGASVGGGKAAISGAASLMFLKDSTNALVQHGASINGGSLTVSAAGDYDLTGASAAVAGNYKADGNTGAINAIVTVAKANVLAEMEGEASLTGAATVTASAKRDIVDVALTVSATAGKAAAAVTVMSLVAGDKMDKEAANMLAYGSTDTSGDKVLDTDAMIRKMEGLGVDTSDMKAHEETPDPRDRTRSVKVSGMSDDLGGNQGTGYQFETKESGKFDASSGMVNQTDFQDSTELDDKERAKAKSNQASGAEHNPENKDEGRETKESSDVTKARGVGTTVYSSDPKDAVVARIARDAVVTARGVTVSASQDSTADLFSGTVGVGVELGGAGIGFGIAILRSNVIAASLGTVDVLGGKMAVTAESTSGKGIKNPGDDATAEARNDSLSRSFENDGNIFTRSIRVVGLAVGVGSKAGLGIAGSVARADNITEATVGGAVSNVTDLTVSGAAKYDNILAVTVAGGGSMEGAGLAGSVAVAIADGTVGAKLDGTAHISGKDTQTYVTTNGQFNARTGAVSVAAGSKAGGTAGVSIVTNKLRQNTSVDRGAVLDATGTGGTLTVTGTSSTTGESMMLGAQFGGTAAVGLGFSLINVNPELNTTIGVNPKIGADGKEDANAQVSLGTLHSVTLENDVSSEAKSWLASVSASDKVAMSGNVLLVFNDTKATAKIANVSGKMKTLRVSGNLDAEGESVFAQAAVGGTAAIGASVSYVDVNSQNRAEIDTDNFTATVTGPVEVVTNDVRKGKTHASAISVSANVGLYGAGSLNAAVARNRAVNAAMINGKNGIGGSGIKLKSNGIATSETDLVGVAIGGVAVNASVSIALNEAISLSQMKINGALESDLDVSAALEAKTHAQQITGSGGLLGLAINVSKAKGTSQALVDVDIAKAPADPEKKISVTSSVTGSNDVSSKILNQSLQMGTVGFMDGVSYGKDVYDNHIVLRGGDYKLDQVSVTTEYTSKVNSVVNPSALGVDIKLGELTFDMADAKGKAYARAQLELVNATLSTDSDVDVTVTGWGSADSGIASTNYFALKGLSIGGSLARAELGTSQAAVLKLDNGKILEAGALNVMSITDNATTGASHGASGTNDKPQSGFEITVGEFAMHYVRAKENIASTAMIQGTGSEKNTIQADSLTVQSGISKNGRTSSTAQSKESASLSLISMGGLNTQARTADTFYSEVTGVTANITNAAEVYAKGDATAKSEATAPGDVSILELSVSHIRAGIGNGAGNRQTAQILIGNDTKLSSGGNMKLYAENKGTTNTDYTKNTVFSAASVKFATIPTESYYNTGVAIGQNVELTSDSALTIRSVTNPSAKSDLDSLGAAALFDYTSIKGENHIDDKNYIDIGKGAKLTAMDNLRILAANNTQAEAKTVVRGGGGLLGGEVVVAENDVRRYVWITIDRDVAIKSNKENVWIESISGEGDNITVESYVRSGGLFTIGKAKSTNRITSDNAITIGANVTLDAHKDLNLIARATSYVADGGTNAMEPDHAEDDVTLDPDETKVEEGLSEEEQKKKQEERDKAKADNGAERDKVIADSDKALSELEEDELPESVNYGKANKDDKKAFGVLAKSNVKAKGAFVWPKAEAYNILNYSAYISINRDEGNQDLDNVEMSQLSAHTGDITVRVDSKGLRAKAESYANGGGLYSDVIATSRITANLQNTIWVDFTNLYAMNDEKDSGKKGEVRLLANNFGDGDRPYLVATAEAKDSGIFGDTDPTALVTGLSFNQIKTNNRATVDTRGEFIHVARNPADCIDYTQQENGKNKTWAFGAAKRRCDFCYEDKGQSSYTPDRDTRDLENELERHMKKALVPLDDIENTVNRILSAFKARYGEEEYETAGRMYVLETASLLETDTELNADRIRQYRLWMNTETFQSVYLLPNATRMYSQGSIRPQYIAEVLYGDFLGDGNGYHIDVITALNRNAIGNATISIGSKGSLNFRTGELNVPSQSDFELYLHEISGEWFLNSLDRGFIRRYTGDQDAINDCALNGGGLPEGTVTESVTAGGEDGDWLIYWIGHDPETARAPEETLVYLLINPETDEVDAFRTSVDMLEKGEDPIDVSLLLFRDAEADRAGIEKYNVMCFDTPEGEKSLVKVITDIMDDSLSISVPNPLKVVLRGRALEGADLPVYSLTDHYFAMCDGTDGSVSMFDGEYEAVIGDNFFEDEFIRVDNLREGEITVTIKKDQSIWPEWTGEENARDIGGKQFVLVDGVWYNADEAPAKSEQTSENDAV